MYQQLISAQQAAVILGLTGQTIRVWVRDGKLPGVQLGVRSLRIPASAVEALLQPRKK
jgi:excisionase family DNA binding protein